MKTVTLSERPNCQFCGDAKIPAEYDAKTIFGGRWAYLCAECYADVGVGLGIGLGQRVTIA